MYFELCTATYARSHSSAQARLSFGLTWCKMCTGLPVAGHGEWMAFLSLPRAEQDAHLQLQMQILNMIQCLDIILAGNDDVPLPRAPPVCVKCNGLWLCKCGIIEYSHKCRRSRSRSRSRSISVFPAIAEIRASRESQDTKISCEYTRQEEYAMLRQKRQCMTLRRINLCVFPAKLRKCSPFFHY